MANESNERGATASRALTIGEGRGGVGEWRAYVRRNPLPDGQWWPLAFKAGFASIADKHPVCFGVWAEGNGEYTVAIKAEAKRERLAGYKITGGSSAREVKRRGIPDLLTLRTYLITLANDPIALDL